MFNNKTKQKFNFSVTVLIVIGIIIVANFFSYLIFYRWDITQNKDYSISAVSKKTSKNIDDIVTIKAYFSKNLPSQYLVLRQEVGDILNEYQSYSGGKIKVEFIDPAADSETEQELSMKGIPPLQFNLMEKDKMQVVKGYLGMVVSYGDKSESIPVIENTNNLEYQVTTAIKKVTTDSIGQVGYVISNGTASVEDTVSQAFKKLQELYDVRQIDLKKDKEISSDIKTLVIVGPKEKFSEPELKMINNYLMKGGNLMVLVDSVDVGKGLVPNPNPTNIATLLEKYGIKVNKDLVGDVVSGTAQFSQGFFVFSTEYPFWPKVGKSGFDQNNAAVANLESAIFPWASSIEVIPEKLGSAANVSQLIKTTDKAWHYTENFNISPQGTTPPNDRKQFTLAVMLTGTIKSAYPSEKNVPKESNSSRIIVVGDSDFAADNFNGNNNTDSLVLFQNLVDSITLDSDLISIRSKGVTSRPIQELSEGFKAFVRYGNIFGMTILVVLIGMFRYYIRRKKKFTEGL